MNKARKSFGYAWVFMTITFSLHVIDEAIFDFLPMYNAVVSTAKEKYAFFPVPIFTFQLWLTGLIFVIIILFLLSKFAFQCKRWILILSIIYGIIMLLNGILHPLASIYFSKIIGGLYSSPLLIISSIYLLVQVHRAFNLREQH